MADGKKLTEDEIRSKVDRQTKKFMKSARQFLATKAGGEVPPEWELSLTMLEAYYRQFIELNTQISQMDSLLINGRYGPAPSPLLACRDKASLRLESMMKEMGITLKSGLRLNVVEAKKEETALDRFLKSKAENEPKGKAGRKEYRPIEDGSGDAEIRPWEEGI